ncbi:DNA glycosylase [Chaetomium sp. MPI-CAGE-AT-0009]|nr:DNA glycosylase [Chaetomium sp. MPI-CAGE-AT-0009]
MGAKAADWRKLPLSLTELCIETTLRCGQSFRWRKINEEWHCVLRGRLISLKQDSSHLHYRVSWPKTTNNPLTPPASVLSGSPSPPVGNGNNTEADDTASLLHSYFALSVSVASLYKQWAASDANFARRAPAFTGIRILNQDAWEALVAFICSSNNNISRISQMVQNLCIHYGPYVGTIEGEPFHDFPGPEALSGDQVEAHLRQLGFGYRARYIAETARIISSEKPAEWLLQLRNPACPAAGEATTTTTTTTIKLEPDDTPKDAIKPKRTSNANPTAAAPPTAPAPPTEQQQQPTYRAAHEALLSLPGVGPKVSDCVCLMGLGWWEAVPVDTHVWQIAQRDYSFGKGGGKTFTKATHDAVGAHFRGLWGAHAGWAQSVLFTANLKAFAGQAQAQARAGGGGEKGKKGKKRVVDEVVDEASSGLLVSDVVAVTKVEKVEVRTGRKRKVGVLAEEESSDGKDVQIPEVTVSTRRMSKRLRSAVLK